MKRKREPDLSQWYKATPEGAEARKYLAANATPDLEEIVKNGLKPMGQAGAVGEDVDNVKKKRRRKKK